MRNRTVLYKIPVSSTDFVDDGVLCGNVVRYGYLRDDIGFKSGIAFNNVKAKKTRAQIACTPWHIKDAYDVLVEIEDSDWVKELLLETKERRERSGEAWELHHYLLYLDGSGCIEVIAASWKVLDEERGSWT